MSYYSIALNNNKLHNIVVFMLLGEHKWNGINKEQYLLANSPRGLSWRRAEHNITLTRVSQ